MGNSPLVSVIIPVYKTEQFLEECVKSVLGQSYENTEIILVDDGSPDKCPAICDELAGKHSNIRVIHKENGGLSSARNAGIEESKGIYVCFMDSDDYWDENDALEKMIGLATNGNADIITYGLKKLRAYDGTVAFEKNYEVENVEGLTNIEFFEKLVKESKVNISACLKLIKRDFIIDNELFFKVGIKTEDLEWAIRLFACQPKIIIYAHSFYVYRIGRVGSITSTKDYNHLKDFCNIIESSINVIKGADERLQPALMSYLMYQTVILVALTGKVKMSREQKNEINSFLKGVCKEYLKKYNMDRKVQLANKIYSLFGYRIMQIVLSEYLNHRGR